MADATGKAAGRGAYVCADVACRDPRRLAAAVHRALDARLEAGSLELVVSDAAS
jgi:predicted RNA-binding protein YlxR (DUF448 family)